MGMVVWSASLMQNDTERLLTFRTDTGFANTASLLKKNCAGGLKKGGFLGRLPTIHSEFEVD